MCCRMRIVLLTLFLLVLLLPVADLGTPHVPSCWETFWHWIGGISGYRGEEFTDSQAQLAIDSGIELWTNESPAPLVVTHEGGSGTNAIQWVYPPKKPQTGHWPGDDDAFSYTEISPQNGFLDEFRIYLRGWWEDSTLVPWNVHNDGQEYYDVSSVAAHEFGHVLFGYGHFGSGIMRASGIRLNEVFTQLGSTDRNALNSDYGYCDDITMNHYRFYFDPNNIYLEFDMTISQALRNQLYDFEIEWNISGTSSQTRLLYPDEWSNLKNSGFATINLVLETCPTHQNVYINLRPSLFCQASLSTYLQRTLCPRCASMCLLMAYSPPTQCRST